LNRTPRTVNVIINKCLCPANDVPVVKYPPYATSRSGYVASYGPSYDVAGNFFVGKLVVAGYAVDDEFEINQKVFRFEYEKLVLWNSQNNPVGIRIKCCCFDVRNSRRFKIKNVRLSILLVKPRYCLMPDIDAKSLYAIPNLPEDVSGCMGQVMIMRFSDKLQVPVVLCPLNPLHFLECNDETVAVPVKD